MANPTILNTSLVSRYEQFALTSAVVIDGSVFATDTILPRGTLLVKATIGQAKWTVAAHATALAADLVRVLQDPCKVNALQDAFASAYFKGFFTVSTIVDANTGGSIVAADLLAAAGFHVIGTDEVELK